MIRFCRRVTLALVLAALAGCTSLLPTGGAPPKLYTLTSASGFAPGGAPVSWQLLVDVPGATAALDTDRVALSRSAISIDYFADAAWTDRAPLMVQTLLVQSFESSGRIAAVARESLALRADFILRSELRRFEADYAGSGPPTAHVQLGWALVKMPGRGIIAQRIVDSTAPAKENQVPAIVDAFNLALQDAMRQIVEAVLAAGR